MTKKDPKSLQDLNMVDRFLFDQVMEVPGMYQVGLGHALEF